MSPSTATSRPPKRAAAPRWPPIGSFIYLFFPFDLLGPIDDALVIWLGSTLFVELAPPDIVEEYRAQLEPVHKAQNADTDELKDEDIIDATYRTDA